MLPGLHYYEVIISPLVLAKRGMDKNRFAVVELYNTISGQSPPPALLREARNMLVFSAYFYTSDELLPCSTENQGERL
jgi:hypothetical protein